MFNLGLLGVLFCFETGSSYGVLGGLEYVDQVGVEFTEISACLSAESCD